MLTFSLVSCVGEEKNLSPLPMLGALVGAINQTKKRQMNKFITMCSLRALR